MRSCFKYTNFLAFALAWFIYANHCVLGEAFSSPSPKSHHSHCHDEDDSGGNNHNEKESSHHSKCSDKGCCQPVLESSNTASSLITSGTAPYLPFTLTNYDPKFQPHIQIKYLPLFEGTGPPDIPKQLISALDSAPNAPPLFSSYC